MVRMSVTRWSRLGLICFALASSLSACAPLPKGEYWSGSYVHLDPPRYTFEHPPDWREATPADHESLGFNRRVFARLDEAGRRALLEAIVTSLRFH
jgi:hypothetical protein